MALISGSLTHRLGTALAAYLAEDANRPEGMDPSAVLPVQGFLHRETYQEPLLAVAVPEDQEYEEGVVGSRQADVLIELIHAIDDDPAETEPEKFPTHKAQAEHVRTMLADTAALLAWINDGGAPDDYQLHLYTAWISSELPEGEERAVRTVFTLSCVVHNSAV